MAYLRRNLIGERLLRLRLGLRLALHLLTTFECCALFTLPSLIRGATFMAIFADILTFMHSGRHQSRRVITCNVCFAHCPSCSWTATSTSKPDAAARVQVCVCERERMCVSMWSMCVSSVRRIAKRVASRAFAARFACRSDVVSMDDDVAL